LARAFLSDVERDRNEAARTFHVVAFAHRVDPSLLIASPSRSLRRLGSAHDGGYVVALETIAAARLLLSFGVATNWDFERDAVAVNPALTVEAFDPSVGPRHFAGIAVRSALSVPLRFVAADPRGAFSSARRVGTAVDYFRFFSRGARHTRKRVWYNSDRDSAAIADILADVRASRRGPVFAKIDIEGSEYRILPWIIANPDLFTGLVVEFHHTDICADIFNRQMAQLLDRFQVMHVHGNNYGDLAVDGSLPLSLEITFAHRRLTRRMTYASDGPSGRGLDAPNDPRRPDFAIDFGRADVSTE
jgi:hypothetical protein